MLKLPIYLDHHATTPVDPRVFEAMQPYFSKEFGNAASRMHSFGWTADLAVEKSRTQIANFIGAHSKEIVITSGATESNNLALKGAVEIYKEKGNHIITQVTEHKAILDTARYLERGGAKATFLPVDPNGQVSLSELKKSITDKTILISIMYANNEIGTIQRISEIGKIAKEREVLFHVDAAQAACLLPIDVESMGIDLLSFSAHKMYGPKGIGVLYVRSKNPRVRLAPQMHGGGHEGGLRSGTLNVPSIVAFGKACEIAKAEREEAVKKVRTLRDRLWQGIQSRVDGVFLNGHPSERLPNNLNISFANVDGESLLTSLNEDMAVSSGSACISASQEPSYVLKMLGIGLERANTSVRFGLGRYTTEEEIDYAIGRVSDVVQKLRKLSPFAQR